MVGVFLPTYTVEFYANFGRNSELPLQVAQILAAIAIKFRRQHELAVSGNSPDSILVHS